MKQVVDSKDVIDLGSPSKFNSCGYEGPDISLEGLEWRFINGPFVSIWANNVPFSTENYIPAPRAKVVSFLLLEFILHVIVPVKGVFLLLINDLACKISDYKHLVYHIQYASSLKFMVKMAKQFFKFILF